MLKVTTASTSDSTVGKSVPTSSSGNLGKSFTTFSSGAAREGQQRLQKRTKPYMETPEVAEFAEVHSENTDSETSSGPSTSKRRRF